MAYDTVKNGIVARLNALGYIESSQAVDFKQAPALEYGNRYIIKCLSGENIEGSIITHFDDSQEWKILIAFERSAQDDIMQLDALHRAKDLLIKDLDKPSNWEGICQILKYEKWEVTEYANYFILDVRLSIIDRYTY